MYLNQVSIIGSLVWQALSSGEEKREAEKHKLKDGLVQDQLYVKSGGHYSFIQHSSLPDLCLPAEITVV